MDAQKQPTQLSLSTIQKTLTALKNERKVQEQNGFFSLQNASPCYKYRSQCVVESIHKWFVIQKIGYFLPCLPFIRHIRLLGSVATGSATQESDLDISIGTTRTYMWSVRFFITLITQLLGVRRHKSAIQNRLCFNHYTSKSNASYGTNNPLFFHIEKQSILLWDAKKNAVLSPLKGLLAVKKIIERTLCALRVAQLVEKMCSVAQIKKIQSNSTPYPTQLPPPTSDSAHLVFYYPKIQEVQKQMNAHKLSTRNP